MKELPVGGISHISGGWYALYSEWLRFCWNPSKTSIIAHVPLLSDFWYYWCQKKCATLILPLSFLVTHTYLYLYESNERMKHIHSNYLNFSFSITFFMILDFILFYFISQLKQYKVIGRELPTEKCPKPPLFQMRIFASEPCSAKSRFWYFASQLRKLKKTRGEIVCCHRVSYDLSLHFI